MKALWLMMIMTMVMGAGLSFVSCGDDDDDDNDNDESYRPYGKNLPACDPYVDNYAWFEINNFQSKVEDFVARYGTQAQSCVATVVGKGLKIACDDWSLAIAWLNKSIQLPIQDSRQVYIAASTSSFGYDDTIRFSIVMMNEKMEILLFQSDDMGYLSGEDSPWHAEIHQETVCEYYADQEQPPSQSGDPFSQVVGQSLQGNLYGIEFTLPAPQAAVPTEDGEYWAILPANYLGVFDWTENCYDGCFASEFLFQLVKM